MHILVVYPYIPCPIEHGTYPVSYTHLDVYKRQPPLEAMACGLPVIGTMTGGSRELFRHGQNAVTYEAGAATELAERILLLQTEDPVSYTHLIISSLTDHVSYLRGEGHNVLCLKSRRKAPPLPRQTRCAKQASISAPPFRKNPTALQAT